MKLVTTNGKSVAVSGPATLATYLGGRPDTINWKSKVDGSAQSMKKIAHTLILASGVPLVVEEILPDNVDLSTVKLPFSANTPVCVHLDSLTSDKGVMRARGRIEAVS